MPAFVGTQKSLAIVAESTWGTFPGSPVYTFMPFKEYGVRMVPEVRQARPFIGLHSQKHAKKFRAMPQGGLTVDMYGWKLNSKSLMQWVMDWSLLDHESSTPPSNSIEYARGPNVSNARHRGMRTNSATLSGQSGGPVSMALELMGLDEDGQSTVTTAQTVPANMYGLTEAEFADCTFTLGGSAITLDSFSLQVQRNLKVEYQNSSRPSLLLATQRVVTLSMTPKITDDTYQAYNRVTGATEVSGTIVIQGLHQGTGSGGTTFTVATITLPRLSIIKTDEQGGMEDIVAQPINMVALKPDSSSTDLSIAYSEA